MRPFIPRFYPLFYKNDYTLEVIFSPNMELGSQRVVGERGWRQRRGIARREESTWGGVGICVRDVVGWLISIGFTETFTGRQWNQESILLFSNIQYTALTLFSLFFFFNMREKKRKIRVWTLKVKRLKEKYERPFIRVVIVQPHSSTPLQMTTLQTARPCVDSGVECGMPSPR